MPIYDGFDESFLEEGGSSTRQSLEEIGEDHEERDKILFEVDSSGRPVITPRVDYSKFENHVFFGSGFWAINFGLARIFDNENGYPWDGELKDKNKWRSLNSDFENWWFDNEYPHQFGYLSFDQTGSIDFNDYHGKINPGTSSFTIEAIIEPQKFGFTIAPIFDYGDADNRIFFRIALGDLRFGLESGSAATELIVDYSPYSASSHHVAAVFHSGSRQSFLYIDGEEVANDTLLYEPHISTFTGTIGCNVEKSDHYSGTLDEIRFWKTARTKEQIRKNYNRQVHANESASLALYYKFNELNDVSPAGTVIDYSGNEIHGTISGSGVNKVSGTLGPWFKTKGDPIFNRANTRVSASLSKWFTSGSAYDKTNNNFIYNLVSSQFIDEDGHEDMQLFLLLIARHFDRLKLYIEHLSNYLYSNEKNYNNSPDELLNLLAKNYGLNISGIYDSPDALAYFFGENILSSGSIDSSLKQIRNQLRRNLVNNLIYVLKSRGTKESLNATFRALGIDEDVVNINEYSAFSSGIETTYGNKIVERRVANFTTASTIEMHTFANGSLNRDRTVQTRVLFNTASIYLTSSIFTVESSSGNPAQQVYVERENLTSSFGVLKYFISGSTPETVSSSLAPFYDNEWINILFYHGVTGEEYGLHVSRFFRDEIDVYISSSGASYKHAADATEGDVYFGTSGSMYFDGKMQEVRFWSKVLTSSAIIEKHTKDFESVAFDDFVFEAVGNHDDSSGSLRSWLKLNDYTGSNAQAHDYSGNNFSGVLKNFSTSADFNFPGTYIYKQEPSYSYDFGINNQKIRLRNDNKLNKSDLIKDIPYLSIDISPVISLNKEIVRWFGDLEKFNNIIGQPYKKYHSEISDLEEYRSIFFDYRMNDRIDYSAYFNLLKWFDANFSYFIKQLLPLDMANSVANFVIEPHLFEYNKVEHQFPFNRSGQSRALLGSSSIAPIMTASTTGFDFGTADPGRFGAAVSASAQISKDNEFNYLSVTGSGVNYNRILERQVLNSFLTGTTGPVEGYGNGYYTKIITGSNYLKNVLNIIEDFRIEDIRYKNDNLSSSLLSSSQGEPSNRWYTGSFAAWQDQRWLWGNNKSVLDANAQSIDAYVNPTWDFGIGYGGGAGQLWYIIGKSRNSTPWRYYGNGPGSGPVEPDNSEEIGIGHNTTVDLSQITPSVEIGRILSNGNKVVSLWPTINDINGVIVKPTAAITGALEDGSNADKFGDAIEILDYEGLDITIVGAVTKKFDNATNLVTVLRFQFFDTDQGGSISSEGTFSGSIDSGETRIENKYLVNEYIFETTIGTEDYKDGFTHHFQKSLPKSRFMRVYALFKFPGGVGTGDCKVAIRGILAKSPPIEFISKDPLIPAEGGTGGGGG